MTGTWWHIGSFCHTKAEGVTEGCPLQNRSWQLMGRWAHVTSSGLGSWEGLWPHHTLPEAQPSHTVPEAQWVGVGVSSVLSQGRWPGLAV